MEIVWVTKAIVYYILSWDGVERQLYHLKKIDCSQFGPGLSRGAKQESSPASLSSFFFPWKVTVFHTNQAYKYHALLQENQKEVSGFQSRKWCSLRGTWLTSHRPLLVDGDQSFFIAHLQKLSFHCGREPRGRFALGLVQSEWKVYVKRHLDREEQDICFLNITATRWALCHSGHGGSDCQWCEWQ